MRLLIDQQHGVLKAYLDGNPSSDNDGNFNEGWQLSGTSGYANTFTPGEGFENSNSLYIALPNPSSAPTQGKFDDFAVWSRALSDAEIADIAAGAPVPEPGALVLLTALLAVGVSRRSR